MGCARRAAQLEADGARFAAYRSQHPRLAAEFERRMHGELPPTSRQWSRVPSTRRTPRPRRSPRARRRSSRSSASPRAARAARRLGRPDGLQPHQPAATPPLRTDAGAHRRGGIGRHINYGVREFGMAAITNGIALHGGFIPYGGTFLTFSRLQPQRHPHGRADEAARDPSSSPTTRSASARTARRTRRSSRRPACA